MPDEELELLLLLEKEKSGQEGISTPIPKATPQIEMPSAALYGAEPLPTAEYENMMSEQKYSAMGIKKEVPWYKRLLMYPGMEMKQAAYYQKHVAEDQIKMVMKVGQAIDKPINALQVGLIEAIDMGRDLTKLGFMRPPAGTQIRKRLFETTRKPNMSDIRQGFIDGYDYTREANWLDVPETVAFGKEVLPKIDDYLANHRKMRIGYKALEFATEIGTDALLDYLIIGVPARAGVRALSKKSALFAKTAQAMAPKRFSRAFAKEAAAWRFTLDPLYAKDFMEAQSEVFIRRGFHETMANISQSTLTKTQGKWARRLAAEGYSSAQLAPLLKATSQENLIINSILGASTDPKIIGRGVGDITKVTSKGAVVTGTQNDLITAAGNLPPLNKRFPIGTIIENRNPLTSMFGGKGLQDTVTGYRIDQYGAEWLIGTPALTGKARKSIPNMIAAFDAIIIKKVSPMPVPISPKIIGRGVGEAVVSPLGVTKYNQKYFKMAEYLRPEMESVAKNIDNMTKQLDNVVKERSRLESIKGMINFDAPDLGTAEYGLLNEIDTLYHAENTLADLIPRATSYQQMLGNKYKSLLNNTFIDYEGGRRVLREAYLNKLTQTPRVAQTLAEKQGITLKKRMTSIGGKELYKPVGGRELRTGIKAQIEKAIAAVTDGAYTSYDDLGALDDLEFESLMDFVNIYVTSPKKFRELPTFLISKEWWKHPTPPFADFGTPAWYWFKRKGASIIPDTMTKADIDQTQQVSRLLQEWELVGGNTLDDNAKQRIFRLAENRMAEYNDVTKHFTPEMFAKDRKIADQFVKMREEFAEIFVRQGKLVPEDIYKKTGKGVPVLKDYVTHIQKEFMDAKDYQLTGFVNVYNKKARTKIDIPMLRKRIKNWSPDVEDIDWAYNSYVSYAAWNANIEPALTKIDTIAKLTGDTELIEKTAKWINYQVRGLPTPSEKFLDKYVGNHVVHLLEKGTSVLPERLRFKAQVRSTKQLLQGWRRLTYTGAMGFNPAPMANNALQNVMNIAPTDIKSWWWGMQALFTDGGEALSKHCNLLTQRLPLEGFNIRDLTTFEKAGSAGFRFMDRVPNITAGFNGFAHYFVKRGGDDSIRILRKFGDFKNLDDIPNVSKAIANAMDAGFFATEKEWANTLIKTTQYGYKTFDMPFYMAGQVGRAVGQFTSWPANYFYSYLPQMAQMSFTGQAPWGALSGWERHALLRHVMNAEVLVTAGYIMGYDMKKHRTMGIHATPPHITALSGSAPLGWSPLPTFLGGLVSYGLGKGLNNEFLKREGWNKIKQGATFAPPIAARKFGAVFGGKDARSLFGPLRKEDEDTGWDYNPRISAPGISNPSLFR